MSAATLRLVFLILAIIAAVVFTVMAFDWVWGSYSHPFGFLGLAVGFGLASRLP
jgi:hypothetical protein